ncbi:hypothetical protein ATANTOWER_021562 [Ataeniobius toweri]|uniref:cardiolipin synthase (CMP-forming) n=1 Tax=Ataeniobius toweri TaxID=208326 RepID=A0ABU7C1W6_9TELE|nr:hypothetical protein [Ataeniobius toweri]
MGKKRVAFHSLCYNSSLRVSTQYENPWTVPNLLCVCRILLAPYLGYLITQQHFDLSLALFALAGATDLLDGLIARTWPTQKSALGSALDPLADKILISVLYVSLTYAELIPAPLTALVIFRDIGLIAAVFWVRYKTVPPPVTLSKFFNPCYTTAQLRPTLFSKVNTAIQLFLVAASLAAPVFQFTDSVLLQCLCGSWGSWCLSTAVYGREAGYTLEKPKKRVEPYRTALSWTSGPQRELEYKSIWDKRLIVAWWASFLITEGEYLLRHIMFVTLLDIKESKMGIPNPHFNAEHFKTTLIHFTQNHKHANHPHLS